MRRSRTGGASRGLDYRVYGKFRARDGAVLSTGVDADDGVQYGQGGFRIESRGRSRDAWLVQGDAYGGREGLFNHPDTHVSGGNVMGRWGRTFSADANFQAQVYYDHVYRRVFEQLRDVRDTVDVDTQQQFIAGRHDLLVGAGFRVSKGTDTGNAAFHFDPESAVNTLGGFFAQDQWTLVPARLLTDRRLEVRAEQLHRLRDAAERATAVDPVGARRRSGARCRARCGCRRGSTPICASRIP